MARGKLKVDVEEGKKLKDTDAFGKCDPYVVLRVGTTKKQTAVRNNAGKNPQFGEKFDFKFKETKKNEPILFITVKDSDTLKDDIIGEAQYKFGDLMKKEGKDDIPGSS
mmetsp:Transcript_9846/g.16205  ORF Transcript_9846/g.16205 Transcript_9846/m.16205 type:complete len:109 (-) Transcript_9846:264-590(-)